MSVFFQRKIKYGNNYRYLQELNHIYKYGNMIWLLKVYVAIANKDLMGEHGSQMNV